jgi:hypothetical protein
MDACALIAAFCERFQLSQVAKTELLKMINTFLPSSLLPKSYEKLFSNFGEQSLLSEKRYCADCSRLLADGQSCSKCKGKINSFSFTSIQPQLRHLIEKNYQSINNNLQNMQNYG